jgi:hypothetical protein
MGREGAGLERGAREATEAVSLGGGGLRAATSARFHRPAEEMGVKRTFFSIDQNRGTSKDHERLAESSQAFGCVAMARLMVRGLARS